MVDLWKDNATLCQWQNGTHISLAAAGNPPDDGEYDLSGAAAAFEAAMLAAIAGPAEPQPQRAIRLRWGRFETVDLDGDGNVVEPPAPCCYGWVLHAPGCKNWGVCA